MKITPTPLSGVWLCEPRVFADARGHFMETYNERDFAQAGLDVTFVQDNQAQSVAGVLRGLHYQIDARKASWCARSAARCSTLPSICGSGSATFGRWYGVMLSAENRLQLYIPPGFAHGYCAVSDNVEVVYKCTALYAAELERLHRLERPRDRHPVAAGRSDPLGQRPRRSIFSRCCPSSICEAISRGED